MFASLLPRLTYAHVMATVAVFLGLATGGAYAAATLTGVDIVDGSLTGVDVQDESIKREDIAKNSVGTGKVIDNDLIGADINESTLGTVPDADAVGGNPSDALFEVNGTTTHVSCNPSSDAFIPCRTFTPRLSEATREFFAVATFEWYSNTTGSAGGRCRLSTAGIILDERLFGSRGRVTDTDHPQTVALAGTGNTNQPFVVSCSEGDADVVVRDITIRLVHAPLQ